MSPGPIRLPLTERSPGSVQSLSDLPKLTTQGGQLRLEQALQLLDRAGHVWPQQAEAGSVEWMQSLVDGLCDLSSRDPLTGLVNRRQFEATLDREMDRVARSGESAMLLLIDIDHFKRINDTYGHAAGDLVIRAVGRALQDSVRPMDTVARIGGEEFAGVLPNCGPAFGRTVTERVRENIERLVIAVGSGLQVQVTVSIGAAFAPQWVRSSRLLWMERADRQLYRAKSEGRNCTRLEPAPVSEVSQEERGLLFGPTVLQPDLDNDFLPKP